MFSCPLHNWSSAHLPCPICAEGTISTSATEIIINPTPSVEKKKKVLKSESIPEFDESLESMTEEQKARVDASMGLSMEDVLKDALSKDGLGISLSTEDRILSAMQHWASIKCAENDREIESMEMELDALAKIKDYWYNRCYQAEKFIEESPCDPDITKEQIEAHKNWQESKKLTN